MWWTSYVQDRMAANEQVNEMSIQGLFSELDGLEQEAKDRASGVDTEGELTALTKDFLGKKGRVQQVLRGIGSMEPEDRPRVGARANEIKAILEALFAARLADLEQQTEDRDLAKRKLDLTLPGRVPTCGVAHPIHSIRVEMEGIFSRMGFDVARGPQAEEDFFNFEALNFPPDHPARDMQDTLVIEGGRLLRTHTSPVQVRTMLAYEPPIRIIAPGAVYRRDDDITHSPMFYQIEGLHIDKGVTLAHLKGVLTHFAQELFGDGTGVRLRPSFFPFTEPSVEVDIACIFCHGDGCRVCSRTGWLEILGAGMVDPNVLRDCGVDPEVWSGWAFGVGVERVAMLKYGIKDIRLFYESDQRFLSQFQR